MPQDNWKVGDKRRASCRNSRLNKVNGEWLFLYLFNIVIFCIPLLTWCFAVQIHFLDNGWNGEDNEGDTSTQDECFECGGLGTKDGFLMEGNYDNRAAT